MPVQKLENDLFRIRRLKLETGNDGQNVLRFFADPHVDGYVLCFSSGAPVRCAQLKQSLSEEDLAVLFGCKSVQKDGFRLQGVLRRQMLNGAFRDFQLAPPATIQVWAMVRGEGDQITLYVPDDDQICFAPILYQVELQRSGEHVALTVRIQDPQLYPDGALGYQVNQENRIPIPRDCINVPIWFRAAPEDEIQVMPDDAYGGQYKRI